MSCPIHRAAGDSPDPGSGRPVEEEGVIRRTTESLVSVMRRWFGLVVDALEEGWDDADVQPSHIEIVIEEALDTERSAWETVFRAMWEDGFDTGREAAIRRQELDIDFDVEHPGVEEQLIRNAERAAEQVEQRITGDLTETLLEANREGLGIDETARLLRDEVFEDATTWQARRVAQTEVVSSANFGAFDAMRDSAAEAKIWEATDDERTRPTHNAADQQTVPMQQPFIVGGFPAEYPGDPSLPPRERVNCRCAIRGTGFGI